MKHRRPDKRTYTKRAVKALLIIGAINGTMPFILAFLGKDTASEVGIAWIVNVVAVILGYLVKSYFETKQERKQDLEDRKVELQEYNLFNGVEGNES